MKNITIDQEFKSLIPPVSADELGRLEASIKSDGCRDALVTWRGTLLDGHNRHAICGRLGIAFETQEIELEDREAAKIWIINNQLGRRNITLFTRTELAFVLEPLLAKKREGRQGARTDLGATLPQSEKPRDAIAKIANVGARTVDAVKFIKANAAPETIAELRTNPDAKIHRVAKDLKETKQKQARQQKRQSAAASAPVNRNIIVGDFRDHADKIADGSLSLIFTDPPYNRDATEMFSGLADFASRKLADGGSILFYAGQIQIPFVIPSFISKLRYWWTCACVHSDGRMLMREYGIRVGWKPIFWFVKGTRDDASKIIYDTVSGGAEKEQHDWQQAQSEAAYWIENLCPVDGIVCDPFLGGGTTAAAAKALGRKWIGFEIDKDTAAIAAGRIA
jgi:hypothetical protein